MNKSHNLRKHPLYNVWCRMKSRCYNKKNPKYHRYGGRGVTVCTEWLNDFKVFYDWCIENGWEDGLQVDKDIKPSKLGKDGILYSPEWCTIVTNSENANYRKYSRFITIDGVTKNVMQWCNDKGIKQSTFYSRLKTGWSIVDALNTPSKKVNRNTNHPKAKINMEVANEIRFLSLGGESNIKIAKRYNINASTVSTIINNKSWIK